MGCRRGELLLFCNKLQARLRILCIGARLALCGVDDDGDDAVVGSTGIVADWWWPNNVVDDDVDVDGTTD